MHGELGESYCEGVAMKEYKQTWEVAIEFLDDLVYAGTITKDDKWDIVELLETIPEGCWHEREGIKRVQELDPEGFAAILTKYKLLGVLQNG